MATKKNRLWAMVALLVVVTGFTACLKNDNDNTPQRPVAAFSVINGIVISTALDLYDNDNKLQTTFSIGSAGINYQEYAGYHEFKFTQTGTTTEVASDIQPYDSLRYYTLVSFGDSASAQIRSIAEDFSGLDPSKLNFRFFNLSPNSPAVDLYFGDTKVDSNLNYVGASGFNTSFKTISSGYVTSLTVKVAGTDEVLATNSNTSGSSLQNGVYTVFFTGLKDVPDESPLKPKVSAIASYY